ncbi:glycosyltransferase family 2 protein [Latilactobacillus curvatus]
MEVTAVLVTYNKLGLLKECLEAISQQTRKVNSIIVIDNHSTDGTSEFLEKQNDLIHIRTSKNIGGAGGFKKGISEYIKRTQDEFCWIMDDDTIPDPSCLEELIESASNLNNNFGFLGSYIYWTDGEACLMNIPNIDNDWYEKVSENLIKIKQASFVSLFVHRKSVEQVGLPIGEFFIWGDDSEYTERLSKLKPSYLVLKSKALHKMGENTGVNIITDNSKRVPRYFYSFRNRFFVAKKRGWEAIIRELCRNAYLIIRIIIKAPNSKFLRVKQVIIGQSHGIVFNPKIESVNLKDEH